MNKPNTGQNNLLKASDNNPLKASDNNSLKALDSKLEALLLALQTELERQGLWSVTKPSAQAMASTQPFAVDAMAFEQWLQWLFIPKMSDCIACQQLPANCQIAPAAEVYLNAGDASGIIAVLAQIDSLISTH